MSNYFEQRRRDPYYKYVRTLLGITSFNAESICDVGSNGVDMISWLPCKEKVSIDLRNPLLAEGIWGIKGDFITYNFSSKFDIVTCLQVMEHIDNEKIFAFANKLLAITKHLLIVTVPYMWPLDACPQYHKQDPIDEAKFASWFNASPTETTLKPVFSRVIRNYYWNKIKRAKLCVVFASSYISESLDSLNETENWLFKYN